MRYISLDSITKSYLLQKGYPLHFYLQSIKYAADGYREIVFDSLKLINTIKLPVNSYCAVDLPCDTVDVCEVGLQIGQYVQPLVQKDIISNLTNTNASGAPIRYGEALDQNTSYYLPGTMSIYWGTNMWNENNEFTGRFFGLRGDYGSDTFKLIRERGQIQLDEQLGATHIILVYISDGQTVTNASQIHPYAQKAIETYIDWQFKCNGRSYGIGDKQLAEKEFYKQYRLLRSRLNGMTIDDIKRSYTSNYHQGIKA